MDMEQYNYHLPNELIAQTPLKDRTSSKLLLLQKGTNKISHDVFSNIGNYVKKGDCIVLNNSRVIPVRLFGSKTDTNAKIEMLLLHEIDNNVWEALVKPARKVKKGTEIMFGEGQLVATCIEEKDEGARLLQLSFDGILLEVLEELGEMPLPPYIKEQLTDQERYQTVYAKEEGSAAAPTAGLHFTTELLSHLEQLGVQIVYITLHVGLGTFRPVTAEHIEEHQMHAEYYSLSKEAAQTLNEVKANNGRIIAVGTTSTRVLETVAKANNGLFKASNGWTDIYIYPPYEFTAIDGLITNFHLPKSTLLLLISAFAGKDAIFNAYEEAIKREYRFFSFGDAMFILPDKKA
ncbi:tRNA preQ1(34) S-adenosylmethionine ribosyltransferase-isomerase QueA [Pseudogracilibacillus auburnensis]|uniref:S-adenosylmethionine:tRNA ribosyltransferase-isomerase n=1 Tax=Pseudogracilibacillus auburnensis TaxID=1494959 RepID=A0A2V3VXD8_9BACI|nr:tRNA preQ1(34) S-adenosylmethionine ribosyltransferase-isomerase QueA [Pseudogracilibacillus auburnensis]MBO1003411.1 tRNA preQ1(34) S-adenosylmethionine ribosyltransferase-isomerase QueA [Pseudogracilibacillus auburnensis]PXW86602.1 S-adenosylmethionine--tRNA ribosyltransferase-isomerase [Pseudogracilibacillus auburnensis]